jgi:hypothetical protein
MDLHFDKVASGSYIVHAVSNTTIRGGAGRTVRKCARMAGSLVLVILSEVGRLFLPSSTLVSHRE